MPWHSLNADTDITDTDVLGLPGAKNSLFVYSIRGQSGESDFAGSLLDDVLVLNFQHQGNGKKRTGTTDS